MSKQNRRRYVRIETSIGLSWKSLANTNREQIADEFEQRSRTTGMLSELSHRSDELTPVLRSIAANQPEIATYLSFLESMIENLTRQISGQGNPQAFDYSDSVIISAAGMEFTTANRCEPGCLIEIVLELHPTPFRIMVIAEVVHCDTREDGPGGQLWSVAVDYRHIRDADQELLIRHIHRLQIEELQRMRNRRRSTPLANRSAANQSNEKGTQNSDPENRAA